MTYFDLPFYPLTSPGMPPPGPDFIELAEEGLGDDKVVIKRVEGEHRLISHGRLLEGCYRQALYSSKCFFNVRLKGRQHNMRFVSGHRWSPKWQEIGPIEQTDVMVIGKCLGQEEAKEGRNFIGPSGQFLARTLYKLGSPPAEFGAWYITNVVRHADCWKSSKVPASVIKNCAPLLEQEVRLVRPKFVLGLGSEAAAWLLGDSGCGVSDSQGRVFTKRVRIDRSPEDGEIWHEFQFMTCLHPAAVLRYPQRTQDMEDTLSKFVSLTRGELGDQKQEVLDHKTIYTVQELAATVDQLLEEHRQSGRSSQKIAIDCEWHGQYAVAQQRPLRSLQGPFEVNPDKGETESWLRTFQFSHRPGFARTVVLREGGFRSHDGNDLVGVSAFVPSIASVWPELLRLFTATPGRKVRLIGHNLRADLPWVCGACPELGETLIQLFEPAATAEACREEGGFDTLYGLHAANENAERKLEVAAMQLCGLPRYDGEVTTSVSEIIKRAKIKRKDLPGYGEIPDHVLHPYAALDVDATMRLEHELTRPGGRLDKDQFGLDSWACWFASQGKMTAELEMEMTGLLLDRRRAETLTAAYKQAGEALKARAAELIGWPEFNPGSPQQVLTVLFGPHFAGKVDKKNGARLDPRPDAAMGCVILNMQPVKTSGKPSMDWERVVRQGKERESTPSSDKEVLGILLSRAKQAGDTQAYEIVETIRNCRFVGKVLSSVLCPPGEDGKDIVYDDEGGIVYEKGFVSSMQPDGRVRTHFLPVDTQRVSSSKPNIQNLSKRRETDLKKILGSSYKYPLRSIVTARPGYVLVESDLSGAELLMMAVQSGSAKMVEHCLRSALPESDPNHYDIHSRVAKACFRFDGPPLKGWLKENGKENLRDIAKTVAFGLPYGRGDAAILRGIEETGVVATLEDVANVRAVLFTEYPELEPFFAVCQARVQTHGYLRTCFLSTRRFSDWVGQDDVLADMKRQAGNFPIQGGIADVLKLILRRFRHYPGRQLPDGTMRYYLAAQIHDAVMSEVRVQDLEWYYDEVLPACMSRSAMIYPCDAEGRRLPNREGVWLNYDAGIYRHWGDKITEQDAIELDLPKRFWPKPKKIT